MTANSTKKPFLLFEKEPISYINILCGILVFSATFYYTLQMPLDYGAHLALAEQFSFSNLFNSIRDNPYPLWHLVCIFLERIFKIPGIYAAALTSAGFVYVTYYFTRKILISFSSTELAQKVSSVVSAALMFIQPIFIPWFNPSHLIGQGSPNILYNPTSIAVKPFAIICTWMFIKLYADYKNSGYERKKDFSIFARLAVLQFLSVFAKPSYAQVAIPAIGILLIITLFKSKAKSLAFCIKTVLSWVPAVFWICVIFIFSFISSSSDGNSTALSFFDVWSAYSPCIPISIILATLFPLIMLITTSIKPNKNTLGIVLGSLMTFFGVLEYGFLMETGDRMMHGNFSWGYIAGMSVFWTFAAAHLIEHFNQDYKTKNVKNILYALAFSAFLAHFMFGVYYYFITL